MFSSLIQVKCSIYSLTNIIIVSGILYVTAMIGNVLKMISYMDVMGHLRRNVPKIQKLNKDGKDIIETLGDHIVSKEVLFDKEKCLKNIF